MITLDKTIPENITEWLADFNTYKTLCRQFKKGWLLKPKQDEKHFLKSRLGIEEYAKLLTKLLPATTLANIGREKMTEVNQYLKEHEQDILKFGYISEETCLDHKTKTSAKGGVFITITATGAFPDKKYESASEMKGNRRKVTYYLNGKELCSFMTYHWTKDTQIQALQQAGFEVKQEELTISQEGQEKFGKDFWQELLDSKFITALSCDKL